MLAFSGHDLCTIDANGRIKLSPRVISDFIEKCGDEVVLHCLPEGALALYPEDIYLEMRRRETDPAGRAGQSVVFRREMRRFGALSQSERISKQGRITIPTGFRKLLNLDPGTDVCVVGVEIGVEIWQIDKWREEIERINQHQREKGEREMAEDLMPEKN